MLSRNVGASIRLRVNGGWGVMSGQVFIDRSEYHRYYKVGTVSKECPDIPLLRSVIDIVGYVVSFLLASCNEISGENLRGDVTTQTGQPIPAPSNACGRTRRRVCHKTGDR